MTTTPTPRDYANAQRVVEQIVNKQIDQVVEDINRRKAVEASDDGLSDFYISLREESDRGLAIVLFAYVDDAIRSMFSTALNPHVHGRVDGLLGISGPLSSAGVRIQMAFALDWLDEKTYRNLRAMQKIRNAFAHSISTSSFDHPKIRPLVDQMEPLEAAVYGGNTGFEPSMRPKDQLSARLRYHLRGIFTCSRAITEMSGAPFAIRRGLHPFAAGSRGFDKMPPLHRAVTLASITAARHLTTP